MIDLAQCDRSLRATQKDDGLYNVVLTDGSIIRNSLTWHEAYKVVLVNFTLDCKLQKIN